MRHPARTVTRVLYVGGVPRSGSTLTDLMLGQLPGHVGLGELFYLWHNGPGRDVQCACGEPFSRCPLWTEVGRLAFGGWPRDLVDEVLRLQRAVDRTSRIPLLLVPRLAPAFHRQLVRYGEILATLYAAVARASGAQVVVDSSKRPSLAFVLRRVPDIDLRVAHVVRDPRGVAFSWGKVVALPTGASHRTEMPRWSAATVSRRWVTVNAAFVLLSLLGVPRLAVRYEDLVAAPRVQLTRIAALHDLPLTGDDLSFVTADGLRVASSHVIAGGRIRLAGNLMPLRVDDEWRRSLPVMRRRLVSGATWPLRWKYGYR